MKMNHWEWEGMGLEKAFPLNSTNCMYQNSWKMFSILYLGETTRVCARLLQEVPVRIAVPPKVLGSDGIFIFMSLSNV